MRFTTLPETTATLKRWSTTLHRHHKNRKIKQQLDLQIDKKKTRNFIYRSVQHSKYIFREFNITLTNTTSTSRGSMLCNGKTKTAEMEKFGAYKLTCNNCPAIYIDDTGRQIGIRMKEHLTYKKMEPRPSANTYAHMDTLSTLTLE